MKRCYVAVAAVSIVCGCTTSPYDEEYRSSTVDEFARHIEWCFQNNKLPALARRTYTIGSPPEFVAEHKAILSRINQAEMDVTSVEVLDSDAYAPEWLPGTFNNHRLEWLVAPSHWIIVHIKSKRGEHEFDVEYSFPAVQLGDHWWMPGVKYAEQ